MLHYSPSLQCTLPLWLRLFSVAQAMKMTSTIKLRLIWRMQLRHVHSQGGRNFIFFVRYISSFRPSSHLHQFSCTWHNISIGLIVHKARHPYRLPWYISCLVDFSMHLDGPTLTTPAANCFLTFFCSRHLYEIMEYNNEYYYVILKDVLSYSLGKRCIVI